MNACLHGSKLLGAAQSLRRLGRCRLPFALCVLAVAAFAQFKPAYPQPQSSPQPPPDRNPDFSVRVNLVRLLVSARTPAGTLLTNLNRGDFHVFDNGVPQTLAVFERNTSLPLSVAILVDSSGSIQQDLRYEADAVLRFIPALLGAGNPDDAFSLFTFNWRTSLEADFSRNPKRAERALRGLRGDGGTSLYDAIYLASDTLSQREGRHVLVVVTDGGDTTSYKHYPDALAAAQRADVAMYPIVVVPIEADAGRNLGGEHALATLAASTGGRIFYPAGFDRLDSAFADILRELRTQYLLGFYPQNVREQPRSFHQIKVEPAATAFRITARTGYYEP